MGDVVAGDDEVVPPVVFAAQDDMGVRMSRVEMIGRDPVEPGYEIVLHLAHQVADEGFEVAELGPVLGRDDEAELVAVATAAFEESLAVRLVARSVVKFARPAA